MDKKWNLKEVKEKDSRILLKKLAISPLLANILINRGISNLKEAKLFLKCDLKDMYDPYLLKGMNKAVKKIKSSISNKENILIFGDYDVDGITSTTVMKKTLELIGGYPTYYFPNRLTEGYGLNKSAVDLAKKNDVKLIITVDCGISASKEVSYAKRKGIEVVIIDHHESPELIPEAVAIVNPKQKGCKYPYKGLAAVGVTFKVAQALIEEYKLKFDVNSFLDFVCLGTVADVMRLDGENRIIVKNGLKQLEKTDNRGLRALIEVSDLVGKDLSPGHIGFRLGPRINAAGRLASANEAMQLFQTESEEVAKEIAHSLNEQNSRRQNIQEKILNEALLKIEKEVDLDKETCIVLSKRGWHKGVIGIVASKIVEKYHRPTILISIDKGFGYGSGRSISKFHLLGAMNSCKNLFVNYGGHKQAAGMKINEKNIGKFKKRLNRYANKKLSKEDLIPTINIDAELKLSQINLELIDEINELAPFGMGNPRPIFCSTNLCLEEYPRIMGEKHLKLKLTDGLKTIEAIGFNMADFYDAGLLDNENNINVAYFPEVSEWNGYKKVELNLKDMKFGRLQNEANNYLCLSK